MKLEKIHADKNSNMPAGLSIEINNFGADFYADGSLYAWQDNNGMFNRCEATGDLQCHVPVADVRAAIAAAESELGVSFRVGTLTQTQTHKKLNMKTIDITPTWEAAVRIYMAVLRNPEASFEGVRAAEDEILRLARMVDSTQNKTKSKGE
jgi:hypothetical protein